MTYKNDAAERILDLYEAAGAEVDRERGTVYPVAASRRFEVTIPVYIVGVSSDWDRNLLVDLQLDNGETVTLDPMQVRPADRKEHA
jgi:hypothetical protein